MMFPRMATALLLGGLLACAGKQSPAVSPDSPRADVIAVQVSGESGEYLFSVAVSSPDSGCERYADWWEVVSLDGKLIHRRVLAHSHVNEQPFTRSSGPVAIGPDEVVLVRAHLNTTGYGGAVMRGSPNAGFAVDDEVRQGFAAGLAEQAPRPDGCAF